ncbi:hypothetical protein TREPR_3025 [Treponema primitia ZAS-2]|uniref:Uncharacterized protein n=1 Tax=Treponema primitia (strain ATCC BAA-887 / DSM 12427 / ZAS-2) TaxID=545694 RepID=F5YNF8_TREPZ|nr:hypothetical protein [Treponema primitia]AEF84339.1 hypothetical protein TREPR_3025 [Treponema primitia ZAS-2]
MATIYSLTTLELDESQKKALVDELTSALGQIYTKGLSLYFTKVKPEDTIGDAKNQLLFFVCVPPYITLEKKRLTIKILNDAAIRGAGYKGKLKVIVLFQYHDDDGVGKDGLLFADAKAAAHN